MRTDTKKTMKIIDSCLSKEFVSIRQLSQYAEVSTKTVRKLLDSIINNDFNGSNFWPEALGEKYNEDIDRESAYEMLNEKIEQAEAEEAKEKARQEKAAIKKARSGMKG